MNHDKLRNAISRTMLEYGALHRKMNQSLVDCNKQAYSEHLKQMVLAMLVCADTWTLLRGFWMDAEDSTDLEMTVATHKAMAKIVASGTGEKFEGEIPETLGGISNLEAHEDFVKIVDALVEEATE